MHRNSNNIVHNIHYKLFLVKPRIYNIPIYLVALLLVYVTVKYVRSGSGAYHVPRHLRPYLVVDEKHTLDNNMSEIEIDELRAKVAKLNMNPEILNWKKFGVPEPETTVLAVQVHRDVERLQVLIVSLAQATGIHEVLLLFSHSFYHPTINSLVKSITFCRVMQIFYPYSVQLNPNRFPGHDPHDCKHKRPTADELCDRRNATVAEPKQHWWWMANMVFYQMSWSQAYKGFVVFLAEDDYVVPDMLHMLQYAQRSLAYLPEAAVIALGRPFVKYFDYDMLSVDTWGPPFDRGLTLNKSFWNKIEALSSYFCMYDDSSWSYSLLYLFSKLGRSPVVMVSCEVPRVMSTAMFPSGRKAAESTWQRLVVAELFPPRVRASLVFGAAGRLAAGRGARPPPHGDGQWSDIRDHLLCLDPLLSTTTSELDLTTTPPVFTPARSVVPFG